MNNNQQVNKIISKFMNRARQQLSQIIISLESDQLIQQMRNDQNLYQQKINYINSIIKQHFIIPSINQSLISQLQSINKSKLQLQSKLQQSRQQYIQELSNIQVHYKQFLIQKQNQKNTMINDRIKLQETIQQLNHRILILNKDLTIKQNNYQTQIQTKNKQIQSKDKQIKINKNKQYQLLNNIQQLNQINSKLIKQLNSFKQKQKIYHQHKKQESSQIQSKYMILVSQNEQLRQQIKTMQNKINELRINEQQYIQTIQKMKQDMFLIKDQWQKKCIEIQSNLNENYISKLLSHQQQMNNKLKQYIQQLKLGKNVIIQSSQQILQSKKLLIQQKFNQQIKQYQQQILLLQTKFKQQQTKFKNISLLLIQNQQLLLSKQIEYQKIKINLQTIIKDKQQLLKVKQIQNKNKQQQLIIKINNIKQQTHKQIQRLHKTQNMLLKDLKSSKSQKQSINQQVQSIKSQFNTYRQKQMRESKRIKQLQGYNEISQNKIIQLKKDIAIMNQKCNIDNRVIKEKSSQINRLQNNLLTIKNENKQFDGLNKRLEIKLVQQNDVIKYNEKIICQVKYKFDKLYVIIRKLSKQLQLIKQDISYQINIQKTKLQSIILTVNQQILYRQQLIKHNNKLKINQLINQFEIQRNQQIIQKNQLIKENSNLKKQLHLLQQLIKQKQQHYIHNKSISIHHQLDKLKLIMQQDINTQKQQNQKLQHHIHQQQHKYQYLINKTEKQTNKLINSFINKWESKLSQLQSNLQIKQKYIQQTTYQLKKSISELQTTQNQSKLKDQKLIKLQKKYQNIKQQRDKTIDQMMKRLEKQTKHKLALQRQLKDIRGEIMKTQTNTNTSSPFNNYSFTDRQNTNIYTNAFQSTANDKMKTHVKTTNRQKQLSEIRQMIAKTYKVMDGAQKDSPVQKGKLF